MIKEALIVYGSLATGEINHSVLSDIEGEWLEATIIGNIEDNGWSTRTGYPYFLSHAKNRVTCKVKVFISDQLHLYWDKIDEFEGTEAYKRILWDYVDENGETKKGHIYVKVV